MRIILYAILFLMITLGSVFLNIIIHESIHIIQSPVTASKVCLDINLYSEDNNIVSGHVEHLFANTTEMRSFKMKMEINEYYAAIISDGFVVFSVLFFGFSIGMLHKSMKND